LTESEEAALIHRCQDKDKEAFRMLVEKYKKVMFGTAYLMTKDRGLAEDAMQEALIQMWKHLPSLRQGISLKAPEIADDCDDIETTIIRNETHQKLRRAVEMLPSDQREVVVLRYFSELTVPEVASVTGKPEGTIKSRLNRALKRLNEIISNNETSEERR
jgi:RNA polymerase sigma-70 factor (ECF subfamily)